MRKQMRTNKRMSAGQERASGTRFAKRSLAWVGGCLLTIASSGWASWSNAAEPAEDFLHELRDKRYFDTALDYLQQMTESPLAPAVFRQSIPYERGVTLVEGAKMQRDLGLREKQLDLAQTALKEFIEEFPEHTRAFAAKSQLGNVTVERARIKVERSKRPSESSKKNDLLKEANTMYDEAYKVFHALDDDLKERLSRLPKDISEKTSPGPYALREQLRADYLQTQLLSAAVLEEMADTLDPKSKEHTELLKRAAKEYGELHEKYRTRLAGLYARMYQGRCHLKLAETKEALSYFSELLDQPDEPEAFHVLKTKVLLLALDCWMHDSQKKYAEAANQGVKWIDKAHGNEMKSDDFMELRLKTAKAIHAYTGLLQAEDPKGKAREVSKLRSDGRKMLQYVIRFPNDHVKEAQKLLPDFGIEGAGPSEGRKAPASFVDARDAGKDALDSLKVANTTIAVLPERIKAETDPQLKKELDEQLKQARETVKSANSDALYYFQRALALVDSETSKEDVELVYYLLSYLYYVHEQYYDAGLIGEFLARRAPDSGGAKQSAKIAMASFLKIYSETKTNGKSTIETLLKDLDADKDDKLSIAELQSLPEERRAALVDSDVDKNGKLDLNELTRSMTRFEADRIVGISRYMSEKWSGTPEAEEALGTLISFMISEGELAKAEEYLAAIPAESAQRGSAELKTGQAMWGAYLRGMQSIREQEEKAKAAGAEGAASLAGLEAKKKEFLDVKNRAEKTLADGVTRMEQAGRIDNTLATAALSLAQIYVDTNQTAKAIATLNNEKFGPLVLVKQSHESTQRKGYSDETYKTSLRAYISSLAGTVSEQESTAAIAKAKEIMEQLKTTIGGSEEGGKQLIVIYMGLARDLETQMRLATPENRKSLGKGFQQFLDQVSAGTKELDVLFWIASTYKSMGESMGDMKSPDAKAYLEKANSTYQDIVTRGKAKEIDLKPELQSQILLELARTKKSIGLHKDAIAIFQEVLATNANLLNVQIEAAKTYHEWGKLEKNVDYIKASMSGLAVKGTTKKTIWGWGDLAKKTAGNPKFHNAFYEARYNLTLAGLDLAQMQTDAAQKAKSLDLAKSYLVQTVQLFPKLAGDGSSQQTNFRDDYDKLLKRIQRERKEKETGLAGLTNPAAAGGAGTATKAATGVPAPAGTKAPTGVPAPAATKAPTGGLPAPTKSAAVTAEKG